MNRKTVMGIVFVLAMTGYGAFRGFLRGAFAAPGSKKALQSELNAMNLRLPIRVDADTQLWAWSVADHRVSFLYKIVTRSSAQIETEPFLAQNRERIVSATCKDRDLQKRFLSEGTTVQHEFSGSDSVPVATIAVTPADCAAVR